MSEEIKEIVKDNDELLVLYKDNSFRTFDTLTVDVLDYINNLQQENQQLKEQLKDENNYHNEAVKWYKEAFDIEQERIKYKSVIDEIRELIDKYEMGRFDYNIPVFEIKMMLDKVKE